jgi:molybdopterin molybdotransferase
VAASCALDAEETELDAALGRVLRRDVVADCDCPSADVAVMDGYCLRASETSGACDGRPALLRVAGTSRAGGGGSLNLPDGGCLAITTGAVLPRGADAVVRLEDAREHEGSVVVRRPVPRGMHICRRGEIWKRGDVTGRAGRRVTPQVLAALAASGADRVLVTRRPRVGILATGDELVAGQRPPGPGFMRASNAWMLQGLVAELGCEVRTVSLCPDDETGIARRLEALGDCDAVVSSGGVSGGRFDLVPGALLRIGAEVIFTGIRVRPGKGTIFATRAGKAICCLTGSPVGAFVGFEAIAKPALRVMLGLSGGDLGRIRARVTAPVEKPEGLARLAPARLLGDAGDPGRGLEVEPLALRGGGDLVGLSEATCLIVIGEAARSVEVGDLVEVEIL